MTRKTKPTRREKPVKTPRRPGRLRRILLRCGAAVLAAALAAAFYLAVIMGQPDPQTLKGAVPSDQALREAEPAYQIQSETQLQTLVDHFWAPALTFHEAPGVTFVSGRSYDQAFEGSFARRLELTYHTAEGQVILLESIYPARAFDLMTREGYALNTLTQTALAGHSAVQMDGPTGVRFHTQGEDALYIFTAPCLDTETLAELTRATALMNPAP